MPWRRPRMVIFGWGLTPDSSNLMAYVLFLGYAESGEQLPSSRIMTLLGARDGSLDRNGFGFGSRSRKPTLLCTKRTRDGSVSRIPEGKDGKIWIDRIRSTTKTHPLCQVDNTKIHCFGSGDGAEIVGAGPLIQGPVGRSLGRR